MRVVVTQKKTKGQQETPGSNPLLRHYLCYLALSPTDIDTDIGKEAKCRVQKLVFSSG